MRILIVHCNYRSVSGEHVVVTRQVDILRSAGHEVETLFFQNPKGTVAATKSLAVAPWNRASAVKVHEAVAAFKPDVVHVHNTWFAGSPSVPAAFDDLGLPTVYTLHNYRFACVKGSMFRDGKECTLCLDGNVFPAIRYSCYHGSKARTAISVATQLVDKRRRAEPNRWYITPSQHVADMAIKAGVPENRCKVIPHFAPDAGMRSTPASASDTVLFAGRLDRGKGVTRLLHDWPGDSSPFSLDLLGDGPRQHDVRAQLPAKAFALGWRSGSEVQARMRTARALVFPSEWQEPFGLVLVEALAAGLPIIGLDVSAVRTIAGDAGELIYSADDPQWLNKALKELEDDEFTDDLSRRSRQRYEAEYSEGLHIDRLIEFFEGAIDAQR